MTEPEHDPDLDAQLLERLRAADPLRDPRWEALLEGRLSPEEARAAKEACERGDAPAGAHEAFEPMSAERRERILAAVRQRAGTAPARRRSLIAIAGGLALTAAIAVAVGLRSPGPLPTYALSMNGGATVRGGTPAPAPAGDANVLRLAPGGRGRITLAPATAARDVEARFFVTAGGAARRWETAARVSEEGAVELDDVSADRLRGAVRGADGTPPREVDLWFVIARAGKVPSDEELAARIDGRATATEVRLVRVHVIFDEAPP
jgi:hypothetical protein